MCPPSSAGSGSRFITARFTAIIAAKKSTLSSAAPKPDCASVSLPTSVIVETMPTGPLRSSTPAAPLKSICRLSRTMRT